MERGRDRLRRLVDAGLPRRRGIRRRSGARAPAGRGTRAGAGGSPGSGSSCPRSSSQGGRVAASPAQVYLHEILVAILQREPGGRRVYGMPGYVDATRPRPGAAAAPATRAQRRSPCCSPTSRRISAPTTVEAREPLECGFAGALVLTTPAPSLGGAIVQAGLETLEAREARPSGSAEEARSLAAALAAGYGIAGAWRGGRRQADRHDARLGGRRRRRRGRDLVDARLRLGRVPPRLPAQQHARRARRDRHGAPASRARGCRA